jgi:hypothetical protein
METKKSFVHTIRILHRNIGFFIVGFIIIYACSGITLIFRDTNFLKHEKKVHVTLSPETKPTELGPALRIREVRITETKDDVVYFQGGSFNQKTGEAEYTVKELIFPFNKFTNLHKTPSKNPLHWFTLITGVLLLFMAVSSFWMFTTRTKQFKKGIFTVLAGVVMAVIILVFI